MTLPIERLGPNDIDAVHGLWSRAGLRFQAAGRDSVDHLTGEIEAGSATLLGVRSPDGLVGVVLVTHDGRKGWINRLAIDPEHRRSGMGLALIDAAERSLREARIALVAALVEGENASSRALFEAAGYTCGDVAYYRKPLTDEDW